MRDCIPYFQLYLNGGSRDEEPLVVDAVNWSRRKVLTMWDVDGAGSDTVRGVLNGGVFPDR